jgi:hypothetical protein
MGIITTNQTMSFHKAGANVLLGFRHLAPHLLPWYEAVALYFGASNTMTLEYNTLHYRHPKMSSSTPDEYRAIHASRRLRFDVGTSSSSFEHDGLGRYGDPINPNGDLQSTPMATCSPW